jgi:LemA protein
MSWTLTRQEKKMKNKIVWGVLGGFLLLILMIGGCGVSGYNRLVSYNELIPEAWAQVENVLQRRFDLIPNLVNTVKGYAKHEAGILTEVARLRSQWGEAKTPGAKMQAAQGLEGALSRLMVVVEQYPNLKADQNFLRLQDELAGTENRISVERRRYNEVIRQYNVVVRRFPTNIIAGMAGLEKSNAYFEADEVAQKAPQVSFQ